MGNRKHYIDNLRVLAVLMLFPYHIFMIYNNWGESWYIHGADLTFPSICNRINWLWMMPALFAVAGISSRYALEKRSPGEYLMERIRKLLIPLVCGMILLVPIQSYLAGMYFNGEADYFDYFTRITDLTGYDGSFTTGHLWFILFLFVISVFCLPLMILYKHKRQGTSGGKKPLILIIFMGLLPCLGNMILDIGGKSPTEYLVYFLLGYFILSDEDVVVSLDQYRFVLLGLFLAGAGLTMYFNNILIEAVAWISVLAVLGLARHYLNFSGRITSYLAQSSFGVYLFHQSWIVVTAYLIFKISDSYWVQIPLIFVTSVAFTYGTYALCRRVPVLRRMFGLK